MGRGVEWRGWNERFGFVDYAFLRGVVVLAATNVIKKYEKLPYNDKPCK
jgi:hypothetical protein